MFFLLKSTRVRKINMRFEIQKWIDNIILRKRSDEVTPSEHRNLVKLWEDMIKFIKDPDNKGVWLAAPQIGINKRLIVVSLLRTYDDNTFKTIMMINPKILWSSDEFELDNEWCLSVPRRYWDVLRSKSIKVSYLDNKWKENALLLSWISARIIQHEVDHLDWVLFVDKLVEKENILPKNHTF